MENEENLSDDDDNWLHEEWITCPACHQPLFRIDQSPLDGDYHFYCDRCPVRLDVSVYEPEYDQIQQALPHYPEYEEKNVALIKTMEAHLKPCQCGGRFRHDAPRRCFSCFTPVIVDDPAYIDLYPDEDIFERALDAERQNKLERWRAPFFPDLEDKWRGPSETEQ